SPEVWIGAREGDDDEKRGPYRDTKNRFGWSGRHKTTLEEGHHGPGKNRSCESAASSTRAFASGNSARPKMTDWSPSYSRRHRAASRRRTAGSVRGIHT